MRRLSGGLPEIAALPEHLSLSQYGVPGALSGHEWRETQQQNRAEIREEKKRHPSILALRMRRSRRVSGRLIFFRPESAVTAAVAAST